MVVIVVLIVPHSSIPYEPKVGGKQRPAPTPARPGVLALGEALFKAAARLLEGMGFGFIGFLGFIGFIGSIGFIGFRARV